MLRRWAVESGTTVFTSAHDAPIDLVTARSFHFRKAKATEVAQRIQEMFGLRYPDDKPFMWVRVVPAREARTNG